MVSRVKNILITFLHPHYISQHFFTDNTRPMVEKKNKYGRHMCVCVSIYILYIYTCMYVPEDLERNKWLILGG